MIHWIMGAFITYAIAVYIGTGVVIVVAWIAAGLGALKSSVASNADFD